MSTAAAYSPRPTCAAFGCTNWPQRGGGMWCRHCWRALPLALRWEYLRRTFSRSPGAAGELARVTLVCRHQLAGGGAPCN